jgi:hypothetical protein
MHTSTLFGGLRTAALDKFLVDLCKAWRWAPRKVQIERMNFSHSCSFVCRWTQPIPPCGAVQLSEFSSEKVRHINGTHCYAYDRQGGLELCSYLAGELPWQSSHTHDRGPGSRDGEAKAANFAIEARILEGCMHGLQGGRHLLTSQSPPQAAEGSAVDRGNRPSVGVLDRRWKISLIITSSALGSLFLLSLDSRLLVSCPCYLNNVCAPRKQPQCQ